MKRIKFTLIPVKYYTILQISSEAGLEEVRKAYRARVKECHPDISLDPDAQRKFIEITEAYEFLTQALKEKEVTVERMGPTEKEEPFVVWDPSMQDMVWEEMEKMRRIAREEARRKFREYQQTKEYKTSQALSKTFDYLFMGLGVVVIISSLRGVYEQIKSPDFSFVSAFAAGLAVIIGGIMIVFPFVQKKKKKINAKGTQRVAQRNRKD